MRYTLLILVMILLGVNIFGQKPAIDSSVYGNWPTLVGADINQAGNFAMYYTSYGSSKKLKLTVCAINGSWERAYSGGFGSFWGKNRFIVGTDSGLSLVLLGSSHRETIPYAHSFSISQSGYGQWLAYCNEKNNELVVRNLKTNKWESYHGIVNYAMSNDDSCLVGLKEVKTDSSNWQELVWIDLIAGKEKIIWQGRNCNSIKLSESGKKLSFVVDDMVDNVGFRSIWEYTKGMEQSHILVSEKSGQAFRGYKIEGPMQFSKDEESLFFKTRLQNVAGTSSAGDGVNIWNYKDETLKSEEINNLARPIYSRMFVVNLRSGKAVNLNDSDEEVVGSPEIGNSKYVLVLKRHPYDAFYNEEHRSGLYLVSTLDGSRRLIKKKYYDYLRATDGIEMSPDEKYVVWIDPKTSIYYCYEIASGVTRSLNESISHFANDTTADTRVGRKFIQIGGWLKNDERLFLYDKFDIWMVDPSGAKSAINVTRGIGKEEHIVFSILNKGDANHIVNKSEVILLEGFNLDTKDNGFWILNMKSLLRPVKRIMDGHVYCIKRAGIEGRDEFKSMGEPIMAGGGRAYLVYRMSAAESNNVFFTKDFRTFSPISSIYPEKKYNWIGSELIKWKMSDGHWSQGILYKPEDFDSTKKYPLIFDYYQRRSNELNAYLVPDYSIDRINIPTYVSNGYLVFVPDIWYVPGHNGKGVLNSVISAAQYLSSFSWVDSTKMGLQGHSFGGWETNFLITHSHIFAAACEAAGVSDQVSAYDQLQYGSGSARQEFYELYSQGSPFGLGTTPWTSPELYIENSPVFEIGNITTPLLMMHCRHDGAVPFEQAMEMFLGMKRAGKKVWLLEYDRGGHGVAGNDSKDYTLRMRQFFDYYLKGRPAPIWMTRGVPAWEKGKVSGLEYEKGGMVP